MTLFYFVRHGKTIFNQTKTFQGGTADSPLLAEGREGAQSVGQYLQNITFDEVLISPQKRAQDTAEIITDLHLHSPNIKTVADLREMEFGIWDGEPESDHEHKPEFQNLVHRPHLYNPVENGGETFEEVLERGTAVLREVAIEYPDGKILVVAHGLLIQSLLKTFMEVPLSEIRKGDQLANTSVSIAETTDLGKSFTVTKWNHTDF